MSQNSQAKRAQKESLYDQIVGTTFCAATKMGRAGRKSVIDGYFWPLVPPDQLETLKA